MKYEEIVNTVKKAYEKAKYTGEHLAAQINVTGEGEGAFYIEGSEAKVNVEPYEYYDRDLIITSSADELMNIVNGSETLREAFEAGRLFVSGNLDRIDSFDAIARKKASATRKTGTSAARKTATSAARKADTSAADKTGTSTTRKTGASTTRKAAKKAE